MRGEVAERLESVADALKADVIIVGRSARPRIKMMRASVARRLIATARRIVVVV